MKHTNDIIRMAREAGFEDHSSPEMWGYRIASDKAIERFFHMAQAAERNKVASWMMAQGYATGHGDTVEDLLQELDWQIAENWTRGMVNGVEAEREACAQVCDEFESDTDPDAGAILAAAIRARGQA